MHVTDKGEHIKATKVLVEQMRMEDRDYEAISDGSGSDDEKGGGDQTIPTEWNTYQFGNLVVNEDNQVP